jgi:hypothetical protein
MPQIWAQPFMGGRMVEAAQGVKVQSGAANRHLMCRRAAGQGWKNAAKSE